MADITEVIHKITYEVNDEALLNATRAIKTQLNELIGLRGELRNIQDELSRVQSKESEAFNRLSQDVDRVTRKIEQSANKTKGLIDQVKDGIFKAFGADSGFSGVISKFFEPFADALSKMESKSELSFAKIGKTILSFGNVASTAISLLLTLGPEVVSLIESLNLFGEEMDGVTYYTNDFIEAGNRAAQSAGSELARLKVLRETVSSLSLSYKERGEAIDELQRKYPNEFCKLERERILNGEVEDSYNRVSASILKKAKAKALESLLSEKITERESLLIERGILKGEGKKDNTFVLDVDFRVDEIDKSVGYLDTYIEEIERRIRDSNGMYFDTIYFPSKKVEKEYNANRERERRLALMTEVERRRYLNNEEEQKMRQS